MYILSNGMGNSFLCEQLCNQTINGSFRQWLWGFERWLRSFIMLYKDQSISKLFSHKYMYSSHLLIINNMTDEMKESNKAKLNTCTCTLIKYIGKGYQFDPI